MPIKLKRNDKLFIAIIFGGIMMTGLLILSGFQAGKTLSEINSQVIYVTPPNRTGIQNALDSVSSPIGGSQKLLINSQIVLIDSNNIQYPTSTYTNIPLQSFINSLLPNSLLKTNVKLLTLTDQSGHLLDLGTTQIGLNLVTSSSTNVIMTGEFWVYMDGVLRSDYNFVAQGITNNNGILPIQINGKPTYTFTFKNEGVNWVDGSTHSLTVYVGNIIATVGSDKNAQQYQYQKASIVYGLNMQLDGQKKVEIGLNQSAVSVFKSDISLVATAQQGTISLGCPPAGQSSLGTSCHDVAVSGTVPDIKVYDNGFLIGQGANINNLPRNEVLTFILNGNPITVKSPTTSYTYTITCAYQKGCQSNFGWSG